MIALQNVYTLCGEDQDNTMNIFVGMSDEEYEYDYGSDGSYNYGSDGGGDDEGNDVADELIEIENAFYGE